MQDLRELFAFSRGELIALVLLLLLAMIGGGILLFERMQEQIPADVVFQPLETSPKSTTATHKTGSSTSATDSVGAVSQNRQTDRFNFKININTAPAESLILLPHVGEVISRRIIIRREAHGPFGSPAELIAVRGIGPKYLQEILPHITAD
jgi:DNA uptake protein ComE-like DNA-binding protein